MKWKEGDHVTARQSWNTGPGGGALEMTGTVQEIHPSRRWLLVQGAHYRECFRLEEVRRIDQPREEGDVGAVPGERT